MFITAKCRCQCCKWCSVQILSECKEKKRRAKNKQMTAREGESQRNICSRSDETKTKRVRSRQISREQLSIFVRIALKKIEGRTAASKRQPQNRKQTRENAGEQEVLQS